MNKLVFMLLHFRNRMFWSFISPILIGFLTFYGNQRSLFRNSGITWLNCIWNVLNRANVTLSMNKLVFMHNSGTLHAKCECSMNKLVLELCTFANFDWFFNVLRLSTITIPIILNHVTSLYLEYVCTNVNRWTNWFSCLLHIRNRLFCSFISPILIGFLTFYGNQRSLFRNSGITWLNCIWNMVVLM